MGGKEREKHTVFWFQMLGRCSEAVVMDIQEPNGCIIKSSKTLWSSKGSGNQINKIVDQYVTMLRVPHYQLVSK